MVDCAGFLVQRSRACSGLLQGSGANKEGKCVLLLTPCSMTHSSVMPFSEKKSPALSLHFSLLLKMNVNTGHKTQLSKHYVTILIKNVMLYNATDFLIPFYLLN